MRFRTDEAKIGPAWKGLTLLGQRLSGVVRWQNEVARAFDQWWDARIEVA
jgi:hypothetical protein